MNIRFETLSLCQCIWCNKQPEMSINTRQRKGGFIRTKYSPILHIPYVFIHPIFSMALSYISPKIFEWRIITGYLYNNYTGIMRLSCILLTLNEDSLIALNITNMTKYM